MTLTGIALIIVVIAFCALVLVLIPMILTVKRTAESVGTLTDMVQRELKPTIQELTTVISEMKTLGGGVAEHTDDVKCFMSALGETGSNLHTINRTVGMVTGVMNATSAWTTGARVAGKYLFDQYLKKKGGN